MNFAFNGLESSIEKKSKIRTLWRRKTLKNKDIDLQKVNLFWDPRIRLNKYRFDIFTIDSDPRCYLWSLKNACTYDWQVSKDHGRRRRTNIDKIWTKREQIKRREDSLHSLIEVELMYSKKAVRSSERFFNIHKKETINGALNLVIVTDLYLH